jgi:hypothetical protein
MSVVTSTLWEPPRRERNYAEDRLQKDVVEFLRWAMPADGTVMAIPNGGKRSAREAARMVGLGVVAGAPDLLCVFRGRAIFIELKSLRGQVSEVQRQMRNKLEYCQCPVILARSVIEVEAHLREIGVPLRASVA